MAIREPFHWGAPSWNSLLIILVVVYWQDFYVIGDNRMNRMDTTKINTMQTMQTLYENIVRVVERGYYESLKVVNKGLSAPGEKDIYKSSNITIASLYKFQSNTKAEGQRLYLMKTVDGRRGTLIRSRDASAHQNLSKFIQQVYSSNGKDEQTKFWFNFLTN